MGLTAVFDDLFDVEVELRTAIENCRRTEQELGFLDDEEKRPLGGGDKRLDLTLLVDGFSFSFRNPNVDPEDVGPVGASDEAFERARRNRNRGQGGGGG